MTVAELLERLAGAFPAFNARAVEAWAPIFRARFGSREGPHLAEAFTACLSSFDPKARNKLFPTPPDLEAHMPSLAKSEDGKGGKPIRGKLERRALRSQVLMADWLAGQGRKIRESRHASLYTACRLAAAQMANAKALDERVTALVMTQPQIDHCYQCAISAERRHRHGTPGRDARQWWSEIKAIADEWRIEITPQWWSAETADALNAKAAA